MSFAPLRYSQNLLPYLGYMCSLEYATYNTIIEQEMADNTQNEKILFGRRK